jgi:hypothetical protein
LRLLAPAAWWHDVVFSSDQGVKITKIGPGKVAFYSGLIGGYWLPAQKSEF